LCNGRTSRIARSFSLFFKITKKKKKGKESETRQNKKGRKYKKKTENESRKRNNSNNNKREPKRLSVTAKPEFSIVATMVKLMTCFPIL
jgi:hypothetical protein